MNSIHKTNIIVDLQFGSCGKGLLAGYLAERDQPDTLITAWAPNAGHTYINAAGRKMVNIALPNGIVSKRLKRILLGPGSVINPAQLMMEIENYADLLDGVNICIHQNAAVVNEGHRAEEAQGMVGIGSTMKGVGAAVIQKIKRQVNDQNIAAVALIGTPLEGFVVDGATYAHEMMKGEILQIEGAQGYSLGINNGFYPYTTSRECTTAQVLSDCAVPAGILRHPYTNVWGAARTYPIRVANRFDADGKQIGWSGPCYPDQHELNWEDDLGMEPELTTVTKLPRRIFSFSMQQMHDAVRMNGVTHIFMNFMNYLNQFEAVGLMKDLKDHHMYPDLVGLGPNYGDVQPVVNDPMEWDIPF
jgi:adenylosuccinate synthase